MNTLRTMTAVLVLALSGPAHSAFEVKPEPESKSTGPDLTGYVTIADRRVLHINHVGRPDPQTANLSAGFSEGLALSTALKLILPPGWVASVRPGIRGDLPTHWTQSSTWIEAMEQIARQQDLAFTLHWKLKRVLVDPLPATARTGSRLPAGDYQKITALPAGERYQREVNRLMSSASAEPEQGPEQVYSEFMNEEVVLSPSVHEDGLVAAVQSILPRGWAVDAAALSNATLLNHKVNVSGRGSRRTFLNALSMEYGVHITPVAGAKKVTILPAGPTAKAQPLP